LFIVLNFHSRTWNKYLGIRWFCVHSCALERTAYCEGTDVSCTSSLGLTV